MFIFINSEIECKECLYMRVEFFFYVAKIMNRNNNIDDERKREAKNNKSK
jgi:hypothetical protein